MHKAQRLINHVALVLDGSSSMRRHTSSLIKVADEQIRHLALRSEELSQETRVSVYLFADRVNCLIFDMDVMRLPSIADLYSASGMTALIDSVVKSQADLRTTSQLYGDHAFLTFVLTDGQENVSTHTSHALAKEIAQAEENWSLGFLVPDRNGSIYLQRLGVGDGNIALWNATSAAGVVDSFKSIKTATDNFMRARASGVRGTRSVFSTGADVVNRVTVPSVLEPIKSDKFKLFTVRDKSRIDNFVSTATGTPYQRGKGYYQLTKTETIQASKNLVVVDKKTGKAYGGPQGRAMVGLPEGRSVRVKPDHNPQFDIFVQSTSINRNLMPNTKLLVLS